MQAVQFLLSTRRRLSTEKSNDLNVMAGSNEDELQKVDPIQVSCFPTTRLIVNYCQPGGNFP